MKKKKCNKIYGHGQDRLCAIEQILNESKEMLFYSILGWKYDLFHFECNSHVNKAKENLEFLQEIEEKQWVQLNLFICSLGQVNK